MASHAALPVLKVKIRLPWWERQSAPWWEHWLGPARHGGDAVSRKHQEGQAMAHDLRHNTRWICQHPHVWNCTESCWHEMPHRQSIVMT